MQHPSYGTFLQSSRNCSVSVKRKRCTVYKAVQLINVPKTGQQNDVYKPEDKCKVSNELNHVRIPHCSPNGTNSHFSRSQKMPISWFSCTINREGSCWRRPCPFYHLVQRMLACSHPVPNIPTGKIRLDTRVCLSFELCELLRTDTRSILTTHFVLEKYKWIGLEVCFRVVWGITILAIALM